MVNLVLVILALLMNPFEDSILLRFLFCVNSDLVECHDVIASPIAQYTAAFQVVDFTVLTVSLSSTFVGTLFIRLKDKIARKLAVILTVTNSFFAIYKINSKYYRIIFVWMTKDIFMKNFSGIEMVYFAFSLVGSFVGYTIVALAGLVFAFGISVVVRRKMREPESLTSQILSQESVASQSKAQIRVSFNNKDMIPSSDLELSEKIGQGTSGWVYKAKLRKTTVVAVKAMSRQMLVSNDDEGKIKQFLDEISLWRSLRHPNIVQFLGASIEEADEIFIVCEFMPGGSLRSKLQYHKLPNFSSKVRIAKDIALGMTYLHTCNPPVLHRDLKSHNILLDKNLNAKVSDFGLSKETSEENKTLTIAGTLSWMAPEVIRGDRYGKPADVYSFAVILWELLAESIPFEGEFGVQFKVASGYRPKIPDQILLEAKENSAVGRQKSMLIHLMTQCWTQQPSERPTFFEAFNTLTEIELLVQENSPTTSSILSPRGEDNTTLMTTTNRTQTPHIISASGDSTSYGTM